MVRHNEELNKRVNDALDLISAKGDIGIKVLLEWLYRDMRLVGLTYKSCSAAMKPGMSG